MQLQLHCAPCHRLKPAHLPHFPLHCPPPRFSPPLFRSKLKVLASDLARWLVAPMGLACQHAERRPSSGTGTRLRAPVVILGFTEYGLSLYTVLSTVPSDGRPRPFVPNICRTDGTVPRPSVPSSPAEDGMSADDGRRRQKYRHRPSSTVTGRHRAVTINTYTLTLEHAVQDINRFIYISRLSISSKNSGSD